MGKSFKKLCSVTLSLTVLFILSSCDKDKVSTDNTTSTTDTTMATTTTTAITTTAITTTTTTTTTVADTTESNQLSTIANKPITTQTSSTESKTTEIVLTETNTTTAKPNETKVETTEAKPQKEAPKFVFSQSLPVKVSVFSAEFEVTNAYIGDGYWYDEDNYLFVIYITMKRCDDGINEARASNVKMIIRDSNGNIVRQTSTGAGMLDIGEQGSGSMSWSVDAPGTYTIEFTSI